jgi:DNA-binding response OmpR family regulator
MRKVLLVEDEINVISFIKKGLSEDNFEVSVALDGQTGYQMALEGTFDIIILDIMLPDKNGIEICRDLRLKNVDVPIIFLTALNTADNVAFGLNSGADDYLIKPFKFIELLARINALLRRGTSQKAEKPKNENIYRFSNLIVNDDAKTVERNGDLISLTATEYRLLLTLLKNKGKVLSRIDLLESAWDINFNLGTNVVDVYINYLRKKLDTNYEPKLIHTVVGMGYVLKDS